MTDGLPLALACGSSFFDRRSPIGGKLPMKRKNWLATLLLCFFLGYLGIHRFYTGHTVIGLIQLLTGGGCGIWYIVDLILIVVGRYRDADGNELDRS